MTWNHRVMKRVIHGETIYAIHEVFYEDDGKLSWTENEVYPCGETLEELEECLERMRLALAKPVLNYDAKEPTDG